MLLMRFFEFLWVGYFYLSERVNKISFYEKYTQRQKLKGWKKLLDEILPNQIFILQKKKE